MLMPLLMALVIGGLILYVLYWGLNKVAPRLGEPFHTIGLVVLVLVTVVFLVNILCMLPNAPCGMLGL